MVIPILLLFLFVVILADLNTQFSGRVSNFVTAGSITAVIAGIAYGIDYGIEYLIAMF